MSRQENVSYIFFKWKHVLWSMSRGQMRPNWTCLDMVPRAVLGENQNTSFQQKHLIPTKALMVEGSWFEVVLQPQDSDTLSIPEYCGGKWEDIWLTTNVWQDNNPKHTSKSISECLKKKKKQGFGTIKLKPNKNKQIAKNLNDQKKCFQEEGSI